MVSLVRQFGVILVALIFLVASVPNAHAAQYQSEMNVSFNSDVFNDPSKPIWEGVITGDIDGTMTFWATGPIPAKDLGSPPGFPWQVHFFTERWLITTDDGWISGIDKGNTGYSNWRFRMNGEVTDAGGIYIDLVGHKVHMDGEITWTEIFASGVAIGPVLIT
ncbi:MAG: hypothetical protein ACFFE2_04075 [Candidatus Thorarchaeota archaeon]